MNLSKKAPSCIDLERSCQVYKCIQRKSALQPGNSKVILRATGILLENLYLEGCVGKLRFEADEPVERGGIDLAPSPLEYFVIDAVF